MKSVHDKVRRLKRQQRELTQLLDDTNVMVERRDELTDRASRINQCVICRQVGKFEQIHAAVPCGHGGFCKDCVVAMTGLTTIAACPICKRRPVTFMKLYI